eukprot:CAMPEP_0115728932 /NCGR_PEP_ID=MMETSP0272-20121206/83235_1 /TAXON_ID=71861 /ORGANISM="Scrippsiella trochoidea, Strain CCMP3099" /LENGTH=89 /DNA_ID=CAMNT_0003172575 /DNA_START=1032 /DNA_END=1302 /DNA_ORIENTATION=+
MVGVLSQRHQLGAVDVLQDKADLRRGRVYEGAIEEHHVRVAQPSEYAQLLCCCQQMLRLRLIARDARSLDDDLGAMIKRAHDDAEAAAA